MVGDFMGILLLVFLRLRAAAPLRGEYCCELCPIGR